MFSILLPYLLCLLVLFIFQRKIIYFPEKLSLTEQTELADQLKLKLWPVQNNYFALISRQDFKTSKGTVLVFHGNAGSANNRLFYITALEKLGYRVILAEYPGYGARTGQTTEAELIADGINIAEQALADFGNPLFLWGESLGSGIVSGIIASKQVPVKGIVLTSPFDSLANVAQHHYWFFLGKWLTRDKFNNVARLQKYDGKIAVILAKQDQVIPNKLTLSLFDSLSAEKKLWQFDNAGHNSLPLSSELIWWKEVMQFVDAFDVTEKKPEFP